MSNTLDELLRTALRADQQPTQELDRRILGTWLKEKKTMKNQNYRIKIAAAIALCVMSVSSISAYAAYCYLKPAQVVEKLNKDETLLQKAFEEENAVAVNVTQQSNGYDITLLGLTSGESLSVCVSADNAVKIDEAKTYAVVAVQHSDQTSMENESVCVSPLINGVDWMVANNSTMGVSASWFVKDGVLYWLMECDDLEIFADRGVQLGVVDAFGLEGDAFTMDADTGVYYRAEGYEGTNALFELPLDTSRADEATAEAYLNELEKQAEQTANDITPVSHGAEDIDAFYTAKAEAASDAEFLEEYAQLLDTQTLTVDTDENISYSNVDGGAGGYNVSDWQVGKKMILSIGDRGTLESVKMDVFTLNADGTVTYERYVPLTES